MQVLSEMHTKVVSGGLDAAQATYAAVLSAQAMLGLGVQGACKAFNASPKGMFVTHALIPALNIIGYVAISELGNWYYAEPKKAA